MIKGLWGKKIGMTQFFSPDSKVVPVTVIDVSRWRILQRKSSGHDGYEAIQVGCLRNKYEKLPFSLEWLKNKDKYFMFVRELPCVAEATYTLGELLPLESIELEGLMVDVTGVTTGKGFQGGVKRHGFTGGRASHGDKLGRRPGSLSGLRRQGRVFKGKRMPGHDGVDTMTVKNLQVVRYSPHEGLLIIKGSVPGKSGGLLRMRKCE